VREPGKPRQSVPSGVRRLRKSRFRPEGNFIVYRELPVEAGEPDFVVDTLGISVFPAFEDRSKARRFIATRTRRGLLPDGCRVARVVKCAKVRPVVWDGFRRPRDIEMFIEQIRREPRLVMPALHVEWLPRYQRGEDNGWRLQGFKVRRTVRHKLNQTLLR
jgi:hypothetical protein